MIRPIPSLLFLSSVLSGCPWVGEADLDAARDVDRDGFVSAQFGGDDCDDGDPTVFPGAADAWYDGVVQDCARPDDYDQDGDGLRGDGGGDCDDLDPEVGGPTEWHRDADADGLGAVDVTAVACAAAGNVVADGTDCDDADPAVGASLPLYEDLDRDGFGDPGSPGPVRCDVPSGYVLDATDCDDSDPEQHPGALWFPDGDGDGFGATVDPVDACLRPLAHVADASDCDDTRADVFPGAPGDVPADGVDTDCAQDTELDFDGDGLPDLPPAVSCPAVRRVVAVPDSAALLAELAVAGDCDVLELATGDYPGVAVVVPVVLRAAAGAIPVFRAAPGEERGLDLLELTGPGVTLEGLRIEGFHTSIAVAESTHLRASGLELVGGVGIGVTSTKVPGEGSLTVWDSAFVDGAAAVPVAPTDLWFERVSIEEALVLDDLLVGGVNSTVLRDVRVSDCGVVNDLVQATGGTIEIVDLSIEDSLGRALNVDADNGASVTLDRVSVLRSASGASSLVTIADRFGASNTRVTVTDLLVWDNVWFDPFSGGDFARASGLVVFDGVGVELVRGSWRRNLMVRSGGLLVALAGLTAPYETTALDAIELTGFGDYGVVLDSGVLRNVTIVGADTAIQASGPVTVGDAVFVVDQVATAGGFGPVGAPSVTVDWVLVPAATPPGIAVPTHVTIADPMLARFDRLLPQSLWDASPLPGSPVFDAGDPARDDPDGSRADLGFTGGPFADPRALEDLDADGMYDAWERHWLGGLGDDGSGDPDADTLDTWTEFLGGTLPTSVDTDGDGVQDPDDPYPLTP